MLALRLIIALAVLATIGVTMVAAAGLDPRAAVLAELVTVAAVLALDRRALPCVLRWTRGARGEETVGAILDARRDSGWRTIQDADTGRGNIDHVAAGPDGVLTVETKSYRGRLCVDRLDERVLKQAYAQAKHVERVSGLKAAPLEGLSQ